MPEHIRVRRRVHARLHLSAMVVALAASACGSSSSDSGGSTDDKLKLNIGSSTNSADFTSPFDATPDPDGKNVYFLALTPDGDPGVFKVAASGGPVTKLFAGAPLGAPVNIAVSDDGKTLFLADSGSDTPDGDDGGALFSLSADGGTPSLLPGTEATAPRGVEVHGDSVYFTGTKNGQPGLFKTSPQGGSASVVASGAFSDPSGVAVASTGEAYVVDTGSAQDGAASVFKVTADGTVSQFATGFSVGFPAGLAITKDNSTLLVSGIDASKGSDVVIGVSLADATSRKTFSDTINQFSEAAGLHRARNAEVYAWADSQAQSTGTVYVLTK